MLNTISILTAPSDDGPDTLNKDITPQLPSDVTDLGTVQDELDGEQAAGESLENHVEFLDQVETYGFDAAARQTAMRLGYLSETVITSDVVKASLEAFDLQSLQCSVEGVVDTLKARAKAWLAKVMETAKNLYSAIEVRATKALNTAIEYAKRAADRTKEIAANHPYATAAAAITAITAAAAVIALLTGAITIDGSVSAIAGVYNKLAASLKTIKFPGKKFSLKVVGDKARIVVESSKQAVRAGAATAMGWTKGKCSELLKGLVNLKTLPSRLVKALRTNVENEHSRITKEFVDAKGFTRKSISVVKNGYLVIKKVRFIISILGLITTLFRTVIIGGFQKITGVVPKETNHAQSQAAH